MKNPIRITVALDDESYEIFDSLKKELKSSQSEIIRRALKFYYGYRYLEKYDCEKIKTYIEMLSEGEHVILDIDHWIAFLRLIESHPEKDKFWELHREVARSHAEQFKGKSIEYILKRLETCNFFRINKTNVGEFTLILGSDATKDFIKIFLEELFKNVGIQATIKEDIAKLRIFE